MSAGVVTVGRHQYAVGLYWENSPGRGHVAQIAKEAATQPGQQADFYVVRPGNKEGRVPQFGLCSSEAGQKAGMPVLAACLANQIPGAWAGAFRLNEGFVVIIVRDDLIVPDGDLFFSDESDAKDRLIQEIGFGGLRTIYAPESWAIPGADTIPLTLLLNDHREIKLQRVLIPPKVKLMALGGVGGFFALVGLVWIIQPLFEGGAPQPVSQPEAVAPTLIPSFVKPLSVEPTYARVWEDAPPVLAVIEACRQGLAHVPAAFSGWRLQNVVCGGSALTIRWTRTGGESFFIKGATIDPTGASAVQTIPLARLKARDAESLKNIDYITRRYLSQDWPGLIGRASDDPLPPRPAGYNGTWNPTPAPWVKRSFTLSVAELPGELPSLIGDLPGAVVNAMKYTPGSSTSGWVIEGVIYENRQ
ncbi:MAG: type 4b pilus protein PilO2 [Alphaproteobacteria bacterium]|nr:type 4b pilus protein PilO2 [Alphaproteobacteria bacterium]